MMRRRTLAPWLLLILACALASAPAVSHARGGKKAKPKPPKHPSHVVLVVLGGGVRPDDLKDDELMPTVAAMAEEGRYVTKVESGVADDYSAAVRILTGRSDAVDAAAKPRPAWPTLPEYVRAHGGHGPSSCWLVSFEGGDRLHLAHSSHAKYGAVLAPQTAHGLGAFGQPMESFLEAMGRPLPVEAEGWQRLRRLRNISRQAASIWLPREVAAGRPRTEAVERALLREIDTKSLLNRGPNPRDETAFRAALTVLAVHRPVLTVVLLGEAAQAQASFAAYQAVLKANDRGVRRLQKAVAADPAMAGKTTFVIVADRARAAKPDAQGRLGEAPDDKRGRMTGVIVHGPGLARRPRLKGPRSLCDLCPTIGHLLGVETPHATGTAWAGLLEPR